jgi:uncharacterized membrane protein YgaE (UPF0421/DUF939 family)
MIHFSRYLADLHLADLQLAVRASIAATASLVIAGLAGLPLPIYAFIAAVIVTDLDPAQTRELGVRRVLSTIIGAVTGASLSFLLPAGPLAIGVSIFTAMMLCNLVQVKGGARVAGYICGIVVLDHNALPWTYAAYRLAETLIGVGVAWAVGYVPKWLGDPKDDA